MNNQQVNADEKVARELQQAEMGQAGGPQPVQYGYAGSPTQVVQGMPVASAPPLPGAAVTGVVAGPGIRPGGYPIGATVVVNEQELIEFNALRYRLSVMCFSFLDFFMLVFRIAEVIVVVTTDQDGDGAVGSYYGKRISAASVWWFGFFGLVFLIGPVCGFAGAKRLNRNLVSVYLAFCACNLVHQIVYALRVTPYIWFILIALVNMWITRIVYNLWKALSFLTPERCQALLSPDYTPNEPVRVVYW
jgi:hypothetical protein